MEALKNNLKREFENEQMKQRTLLEKQQYEDNQSCNQLVSIIEQKTNYQKSSRCISDYKLFYTKCKAFDDMTEKYKNHATFKKHDYVNYMYYKYNPETEKIDFELYKTI
jgi:hypothetical protein